VKKQIFDFGSQQEFLRFEIWAFGYHPDAYDLKAMESWNALHGDEWLLGPDDTMADFLRTAYNMYVKEKTIDMDKKMAKVTKKIKTAEKDIKMGKEKIASRVLKSAEKQNKQLTRIDKNIRDPKIEVLTKIEKLTGGKK